MDVRQMSQAVKVCIHKSVRDLEPVRQFACLSWITADQSRYGACRRVRYPLQKVLGNTPQADHCIAKTRSGTTLTPSDQSRETERAEPGAFHVGASSYLHALRPCWMCCEFPIGYLKSRTGIFNRVRR